MSCPFEIPYLHDLASHNASKPQGRPVAFLREISSDEGFKTIHNNYMVALWLFTSIYLVWTGLQDTIHNNYMVAMWLTFPFLTSRLTKASKPYIIVWLQCGLSLRDISSDQAFKTVLYGSNVARRVETSRLTRPSRPYYMVPMWLEGSRHLVWPGSPCVSRP